MKWLTGSLRFVLVTVGIIVVTSLGIDATQYFEGSGSALSILTEEALEGSCPAGMVEVTGLTPKVCIDAYEASAGSDCTLTQVSSINDTAANSNQVGCEVQSVAASDPWTFINYHQAASMCARAGKRLPTNIEWYQAALGTPDNTEACNIAGSKSKTGEYGDCVSGVGAHDMIGNVWEWVADEVVDQTYSERRLPEEGFVAGADVSGMALTTTSTPQVAFNEDYFWSKPSGNLFIIRGGFYRSGPDAGLFSVHADIASDFAGQAVGFRCVKDV